MKKRHETEYSKRFDQIAERFPGCLMVAGEFDFLSLQTGQMPQNNGKNIVTEKITFLFLFVKNYDTMRMKTETFPEEDRRSDERCGDFVFGFLPRRFPWGCW